MKDNNQLEQKQQYLREEILEKSYDIDEFTDFMSKYKENGTDLHNWEFIELKEAVKIFKNKENEDEDNKIEKGVEKIRQSYHFNEPQDYEQNTDEYLDINLQFINNENNINNNNNCVNNILNEYLKNKESENTKINKDLIKEENMGKDNLNNNLNEKNDIKINNTNSNNKNKEVENLAFQTMNSNCSKSKNNLEKNKEKSPESNHYNHYNNINNVINNQNIIADNIVTKENLNMNINNNNYEINQKQFEDFEILENSNINNKTNEIIKCVKQPENSLTKKDNLYVDLSM